MNIQYISGFFDADGSITLSKKRSSSLYRYPKIDFTNTKIKILIEIERYLKSVDIVAHISKKDPRKNNHSQSFVLSISGNNAIKLCYLLNSLHPVKRHRINTILKHYKKVTPRNGKYNKRLHSKKLAFERMFFWTSVS